MNGPLGNRSCLVAKGLLSNSSQLVISAPLLAPNLSECCPTTNFLEPTSGQPIQLNASDGGGDAGRPVTCLEERDRKEENGAVRQSIFQNKSELPLLVTPITDRSEPQANHAVNREYAAMRFGLAKDTHRHLVQPLASQRMDTPSKSQQVTDRKIFVGSSTEALSEASFIANVIRKQPGMEAVIWNRDAFAVGTTLLETIEKLPFDFHGAVLLATPDVSCDRDGKRFRAPVANVIFEYGYLAARLTRKRVAICRFQQAEVPSDLGGMKVVTVNEYRKKHASALPRDAEEELSAWLRDLPAGAGRIPAISQVHGYSGTWTVESRFSLWRGIELKGEDKVFWEGKTYLALQEDGERGSGIQVGDLYIVIGQYRARFEVVNEIVSASVGNGGVLKLRVRVLRREGPKNESGSPSHEAVKEPLPQKEFEIVLHPVAGESKKLEGIHEFRSATTVHQRAHERWEYSGLLGL